jgi:acyl-CoA reductase-like NAD-dependent aldehyde dehydrogenase
MSTGGPSTDISLTRGWSFSEPTRRWLTSDLPAVVLGGRERAGSGAAITVEDPGLGDTLVVVDAAGPADVEDAVAAARVAFDDGPWPRVSADERERVLCTLAELVHRDRTLLAELEVLDTGKPLGEALACVDEVISVLGYYAGWANKAEGAVIPAPPRFHAYTTRSPLGVCGAIIPWNYPLSILSYKLAPALAMGNTVVVKPSELAPLGPLHLGRLCHEAGLPDGVVDVLVGGGDVGAALAAHPRVDKLAFTGSTTTGKKVMAAASGALTRVSLELGGKSAHLVFPDADLDAAADSVIEGIFTNAGQVCVAGSRLVVHHDIHDEFLETLAGRAAALAVGHGMAPGTQMGPLISGPQRSMVLDHVERAARDGAQVVTGGRALDRPGYFAEPTIVAGLAPDAPIVQQEVFGPVLSVLRFRDDAEAMQIANSTPYGLAAGLWTSDLNRAHVFARGLDAGTVWVNTYGVFHPTLPFGGVRGSGFGRELGAAAIDHYTEPKTAVFGIR